MKLCIYLLGQEQVACVSGTENGAAFGVYDLEKRYYVIRRQLLNIKNLRTPTNNDLETEIFQIGKIVFDELIRKDSESFIEVIYDNYMNSSLASPLDHSISFMMDRKHLDLPIEFMIDRTRRPVATRVPVYKTLVTSGFLYERKNEVDPSDAKVLLVSSDTQVDRNETVKDGLDDIQLGTKLGSLDDIDKPRDNEGKPQNEIDEIEDIIAGPRAQAGKPRNVDVYHTINMDYTTFRGLISSDQYNIIHYNGHGYFDYNNPKRNYIFFWQGKGNNRGKVVALSHNEITSLMTGNKNLQLIYLSCCKGAAANTTYQGLYNYTGMLDAISTAGIPNVVGMRWPIGIEDSKRFAHIFYDHLFRQAQAHHQTIEAALTIARSAALNYDDHSVWCSPVLLKQQF